MFVVLEGQRDAAGLAGHRTSGSGGSAAPRGLATRWRFPGRNTDASVRPASVLLTGRTEAPAFAQARAPLAASRPLGRSSPGAWPPCAPWRPRVWCPGHHALAPSSAVTEGVRNIAITNAAIAMPHEIAKPICSNVEPPARISEAKVPARIRPAEAIVGPAGFGPPAAASLGVLPSVASSRRRDTIRML